MPNAAVGSNELHYVLRGEGEPLLLIMGMSGSHLHWGEPFLAQLDEHFQTLSYDHRGVGESTPLEGAVTIKELAADAASLMEAVGWDSAHVMGISMGGMVAQELALAHPERIRTLTLGCTYCGGPGSSLAGPDVVQALGEAMMSGDRERAIRAGFDLNVSAEYAADPANFDAFHAIAEQIAVAVPVIMAQMGAISGHDTSAQLPRIAAPTLVIHGTEDRMVPVPNANLIADAIPGARLEIFDGVGHLFFWERVSEAAALVAGHASAPATT